jgi:hypothetical protein
MELPRFANTAVMLPSACFEQLVEQIPDGKLRLQQAQQLSRQG